MKMFRVVLSLLVVAFVAALTWLLAGTPAESGPVSLSGGVASSPGAALTSFGTSSASGSPQTAQGSQSAQGSQGSQSAQSSQSGTGGADEYVNLTLVNQWNYLPEDFVPDVTVIGGVSSYRFDSKAVQHLRDFIDAAGKAGYKLTVNSAYRSIDKQRELYEAKVQYHIDNGMGKQQAQQEALKRVLYPGSSEHNLGLAVDILDSKWASGLVPEFANTDCFSWLKANCHKYGFILRYPDDKQQITGVDFEPWHYRYVGKTAAAEIMSAGVCLEEYLG